MHFTPIVTLKNHRSLIRTVQSICLQSFIDVLKYVLQMCKKRPLLGVLKSILHQFRHLRIWFLKSAAQPLSFDTGLVDVLDMCYKSIFWVL